MGSKRRLGGLADKPGVRRTLLAVVAVTAASLWLPGGAWASKSGTPKSGTQVHGSWVNADPCVLTSYDPASGDFRCVGSSVWTGTWTGVTEFTAEGKIDLLTGDSSGTIEETFVGQSSDGGSGKLRLTETFEVDGGVIRIDARIVDGTDDFVCSSGQVEFHGPVTAVGNGYGDYSGSWRRHCEKRKRADRRRRGSDPTHAEAEVRGDDEAGASTSRHHGRKSTTSKR